VITALDFFCGAGGLSLGASQAGLRVIGGVDNDKNAIAIHDLNFPECQCLNIDVSTINGKEFRQAIRYPDVIVGGPPCPGFSRIGLKRLDDPRNNLFHHFFRLVSEMQPKAFLAENVEGILDKQHQPIINNALDLVRNTYNILPPFKACAKDYGVPTTRTRVFFLGLHKDIGSLEPLSFKPKGVQPITVGCALQGLPVLNPEWLTEADDWQPIQPFPELRMDLKQLYHGCPPNLVGDPLSLERLSDDPPLVSGFLATRHSPEEVKRYSETLQGKVEPVSHFLRLDPRGFCPTLRAGTGKEHGNYTAPRPIHPTETRVITVRETARLQGFPDWFRFSSVKMLAHRQIGNSVCPPLAKEILAQLCRQLAP